MKLITVLSHAARRKKKQIGNQQYSIYCDLDMFLATCDLSQTHSSNSTDFFRLAYFDFSLSLRFVLFTFSFTPSTLCRHYFQYPLRYPQKKIQ